MSQRRELGCEVLRILRQFGIKRRDASHLIPHPFPLSVFVSVCLAKSEPPLSRAAALRCQPVASVGSHRASPLSTGPGFSSYLRRTRHHRERAVQGAGDVRGLGKTREAYQCFQKCWEPTTRPDGLAPPSPFLPPNFPLPTATSWRPTKQAMPGMCCFPSNRNRVGDGRWMFVPGTQ